MVKAIWVVLVIHQSILKYKEKNIETHFAYEDGDYDYGHMAATCWQKQYKSKCWSKILMMIKKAWKSYGSQYEDHVLLCLKLSCKV